MEDEIVAKSQLTIVFENRNNYKLSELFEIRIIGYVLCKLVAPYNDPVNKDIIYYHEFNERKSTL
jgi:hypothetical protein